MTVKEFDMIASLTRRFSRPSRTVEVGIGDDAAVVSAGSGLRWALTTDAMVEGVHFVAGRGSAHQLGRKALAINLSDLAAMGASPRYALVALGLPEETEEALIDELYDGLETMAGEHRVAIVGGNITRARSLSITITAVGDLAGPGLTRAGGSPGDRLLVTGLVGSAALGRALLEAGREPSDDDEAALVARHLDPRPRVEAGEALRLIATAGIDLSDGLAQDAGHLAAASSCAARLELDALPRSSAYDRLTVELEDPWAPALAGGEDYELLLAVPAPLVETARASAAAAGVPLIDVGALEPGRGVTVVDAEGQPRTVPAGWSHL